MRSLRMALCDTHYRRSFLVIEWAKVLLVDPLTRKPRACAAILPNQVRSYEQMSSFNDLEFAYAPVRDQVRDLREYL